MTVWTVWEHVNEWLGDGGDYLERIFQNKEDAEKYCKQKNKEAKEDEEEEISFYVEDWPVY